MNSEIPLLFSEIKEEAPSFQELNRHEVSIWEVRTGEFHSLYTRYRTVLSNDEILRAERFHQTIDAQRFLTGAIALRLLLSAYLKVNAADIQFERGRYGKPSLAGNSAKIHFNLSHSGNVILIAFSLTAIGVDVEKMNPQPNISSVFDHVFNEEEKSYLHRDQEKIIKRFYLLWTRKESMLKQNGIGIHETMNSYSVLAQKPRKITNGVLKVKVSKQINSFLLPTHPHYMASICYDHKITTIHYHTFTLSTFETKA